MSARPSSTGELDAAALTSALQAALASPSYRPPILPTVALELLTLTRSPDAELSEVVRLLEREPVLAARVLGIAQSAHYSRRSPMVSLRQAAVRLGMETLTQIVLRASLELKVFNDPNHPGFAQRLAHHSTAMAHVTRAVCRRAGVASEHAFTCGLVHDIGFSACLLLVAESPRWRSAPFSVLAPVLDAVHADASGLLARLWKLPDAISTVVATHHHVAPDGVPSPVNAAMVLAQQLCWEAGAGILPPPADANSEAVETPEQPLDGIDTNWRTTVAEAAAALRLGPAALLAARAEAFDLVSELGLGLGTPRA